MLLLFLASGCVQPLSTPYVGDCADYPSGAYDFGDIGIGTCISGPISLDWLDTDRVVVANANPYRDYTGGSILSIDLSLAPTDGSEVVVTDLEPSAVDMPSFPGYAAYVPEQELVLATNRLSEDSRTRVGFDDLYFVDVSDPANIVPATVGPDGEDHIELMSDPTVLDVDHANQLAFVANLTSHTISVVDLAADPIDVQDAAGIARVSQARFFDVDRSGSQAELGTASVLEPENLLNQTWSLLWVDGTYRLWISNDEGVYRIRSAGDEAWRPSAFGYEFDVEASSAFSSFSDVDAYTISSGELRMAFVDSDIIRIAETQDYSGEWAFYADPILSGTDDGWDQLLGGPTVVIEGGVHHLFYDGQDADGGSGIGLAESNDGFAFSRVGDDGLMVGVDNGDHDTERVADPEIIFDGQAGIWRMYYSAFNGVEWSIGHATSTNLESWEVDDGAVFSPDSGSAASPVVVFAADGLRMYTVRGDGAGWEIGLATSIDGSTWIDQGVVEPIDGTVDPDEPPGITMQASVERSWSLEGDTLGALQVSLQSGDILRSTSLGLELQVSNGALFNTTGAPADGATGVQVDSWDAELGLAWLTLTDSLGEPRIGLADFDGVDASIRSEPVLEGEAGRIDSRGASSPVVFDAGGQYVMLYAAADDTITRIAWATSPDGETWTANGDVALEPGQDWDSARVVPGSVIAEDDGSFTLYYTGSDGERTRVGIASSTDGLEWERVETEGTLFEFAGGAPGDFDDSAVRHPWVIDIDGERHMYYAGFDGDFWRVGHAVLLDGVWERTVDSDGEPKPIVGRLEGNFDSAGAFRPIVQSTDDGLIMVYTGQDADVPRSGIAVGSAPDRFYRDPAMPTVGDVLEFTSYAGDDGDTEAISLEGIIDETTSVDGLAVSWVHIDDARGFLYVGSKIRSYIYVIDIRDDSVPGYNDANYMDIESILVANTDVGAAGFRGLLAPEGSPYLFALNSAPDSVMLFDMALVEDNDRAEVHFNAVVGYLAVPRGGVDEGAETQVSMGPAQLLIHEDRLYVANFNANSVTVYDLDVGTYGSLVAEIEGVGENPHALALSPDGTRLLVASYVGGIIDLRSDSRLTLIDVDADSDSFHQVLATVVNQ